ncbi:EpsG family protein [Shewanella sp.]|uniref:EpsG family protein n=1 Tax=Shewanella sp. TaxID=50422 RepID=UPI001EC46ADF|nr:EpsG family protein [Shewanella sp.]NRB25030.1 EpsG family protein [Shewanella sp.]
MNFYLLVLLLIFFSGIISSSYPRDDFKINVVFTVFFVILSSILVSSRALFEINSDDMIRYYDTYLYIRDVEYSFVREPIFYIYNYILNLIFFDTLSPRGLLLIYALTINSLFAISIYKLVKREYFWLCLFCVFTATPFLFTSGQLIRQTISLALFLCYVGFKDESKVKSYIFLILALLVHYVTALIFVFYIFLEKKPLNRKLVLTLLACSIVIGGIFESVGTKLFYDNIMILDFGFMTKKIQYYLIMLEQGEVEGGISVVKLIFTSLIFVYFFSQKEKNKFFILSQMMAILVSISFVFSGIDTLSRRFFIYYSLIAPIYIPYVIEMFSVKSKILIRFVFISFFMLLLIKSSVSKPSGFSLFSGSLSLY